MNRVKRIILLCLPVVTIATIVWFVSYAYHFLPERVQTLKIVFDRPVQAQDFVVYISDSAEAAPNLSRPFFAQTGSDSVLLVKIGERVKLRQARLYFQRQIDDGVIRKISLIGKSTESSLKLSQITSDLIQLQKSGENPIAFHVTTGSGYAYIETPPFYYPFDYWLLAIAMLVAVGLAYVFYFVIRQLLEEVTSISWMEWSVIAFILSIMLPQVFFNVTLAVSTLFVIRNFSFDRLLSNRLNLLYAALFVVYLLSFLYFSSISSFSYFEKYLGLLALPVYASCIKNKRILIFFCVSALLIGGAVLTGALVNVAVFRNVEVVQSDKLSAIIHPVYYSYLVAFSILYLELGTNLRHKHLISIILFVLLILSGSKLVIFSMVVLSLFFLRPSVKVILVPLLLMSMFLYSPIRKEFGLVFNSRDLSVLSEPHLSNPTDERLNGFTLRIMLWQENLRVEKLSRLIFGNGIGPEGKAVLEANLRERGLTNHVWYNAHNQYLTTFFHTGLVGLMILISIVMYLIWMGYRSGNRVLLFFSVVTALAFMSESVFERVSGIALFSLILLLMTNGESQENNKLTIPQAHPQ